MVPSAAFVGFDFPHFTLLMYVGESVFARKSLHTTSFRQTLKRQERADSIASENKAEPKPDIMKINSDFNLLII